jgi:hypothetical protein
MIPLRSEHILSTRDASEVMVDTFVLGMRLGQQNEIHWTALIESHVGILVRDARSMGRPASRHWTAESESKI